MIYNYSPKGVCSREFIIDIDNDIINEIKVIGGCSGNLQGIASLLKGMKIEDAIKKLKGIKCGMRDTSCPDQIARALESIIKDNGDV